jgi:hypothetical protein
VLLAAGMAGYNLLAEKPMGGMEEASLLAGFLSYKVCLMFAGRLVEWKRCPYPCRHSLLWQSCIVCKNGHVWSFLFMINILMPALTCTELQAALLLVLWDSVKPRFDPEATKKPARPEIPVLPDVEDLAKSDDNKK